MLKDMYMNLSMTTEMSKTRPPEQIYERMVTAFKNRIYSKILVKITCVQQ